MQVEHQELVPEYKLPTALGTLLISATIFSVQDFFNEDNSVFISIQVRACGPRHGQEL